MRLATRCPSCTTMFLVVEDQLRVSDGWVRCGRCANVFNAAEDLMDVGSGEPVKIDLGSLQAGARLPAEGLANTPGAAPAPPPAAARRNVSPSAAMPLDDLPDRLLRAPSEPFDDERPPPAARAPQLAPPPAWPPSPAPAEPDAETLAAPDQGWATEVPGDAAATIAAEAPTEIQPALAEPDPDLARPAPGTALRQDEADQVDSPGEPSFLRRAEQADRWRRSPQRAGLGALGAGLGLVLLLQLAFLWRDALATHVPATAPVFRGLCGLLGCQLQPLRRIEQLAVDSSALTKADEAAAATGYRYRLSVQLRNRADTEVMAPALELTLSDVQGETVVRRVLRLRDFGVAADALAPGQELPLRLQLDTGARRVDGYTVELFYP